MTPTAFLLSEMPLWPEASPGANGLAAVKKISPDVKIATSFFTVLTLRFAAYGILIMLVFFPGSVHPAGYFEPAPLAAPVAAAAFAVPLAHTFPFFAIGDDRVAVIDKSLKRRRRNAVNDRDDLSRAALGTGTSFLPLRALMGGLF
jgi:hypothetical protein